VRQWKSANGGNGSRLAAQVYANGEKLDGRIAEAARAELSSRMLYE
jgi:hypothetical protein